MIDCLVTPYCKQQIGKQDFDLVKEIVLEVINESNIQFDFECVADFYDAYLTAVDPADLDISLIGYVFFFN